MVQLLRSMQDAELIVCSAFRHQTMCRSAANLLHWSRGSVAVRVTTAPGAARGEDRGWTDAKLASFHDATAH